MDYFDSQSIDKVIYLYLRIFPQLCHYFYLSNKCGLQNPDSNLVTVAV